MTEYAPKEQASTENQPGDMIEAWIEGKTKRYDGTVYAVEQLYEGGPTNLIQIDPPTFVQRALGRLKGKRVDNKRTILEEIKPGEPIPPVE